MRGNKTKFHLRARKVLGGDGGFELEALLEELKMGLRERSRGFERTFLRGYEHQQGVFLL